MINLLKNVTANDVTTGNNMEASSETGSVGLGFHADGTFDTCTITVFISNFGLTNGVALADLTFTEAGYVMLTVPSGVKLWAQVTSVGAGTSVSLRVSGAGNQEV